MIRKFTIKDFLPVLKMSKFIGKRTQGGTILYCDRFGTFSLLYSCFEKGTKISIPYAWCFSFDEFYYIGRTIEELEELTDRIKEVLELGETKKLVVYDCEIAYNFHSYIRHVGEIENLFARAENQPLCYEVKGLCFKDFNAIMGEKLIEFPLYTKEIVTENSKLKYEDIEDLELCAATMYEAISAEVSYYKNIVRVPLTSTGRARKVLKSLLRDVKYRTALRSLTVVPEEILLMNRAFTGCAVIANESNKNQVLEEVASFDLNSSYLSSVCSHMFPMSKGVLTRIENVNQARELCKSHLWIGYVKLENVVAKYPIGIIAPDKCFNLSSYTVINNKIEIADSLIIAITSVDFELIEKFYSIGKISFGACYVYKKAYLPKSYLELVLGFYKDKTELKGVKGKEKEYTVKKSILNASCYGVMVQNPLQDEIKYIKGHWVKKSFTIDEQAERYNNDLNRFSFYGWGIFVSAYSRETLLNSILSTFGENDFTYSDTDSIKLKNYLKHKAFFDEYNKWITSRIAAVCDYYNIYKSLTIPETVNGVKKPLGVWEFEGVSPLFETTGEKRYISINEDGEFSATISGVNSEKVSEYLGSIENPFEAFTDTFFNIPEEYSGRSSVYLIKTERRGIIKDRNNEEHAYYSKSGVYQCPSSFNLGLSDVINRKNAERRSI